MKTPAELFAANRIWADKMREGDTRFFTRLVEQQNPDFLWIGCSDSRVPANEIVGLLPGELFVHRNVANQVVHTDLNCLSVIQYAVEALSVEHVIVCGHYGCGGVQAALEDRQLGLIDNWLRHVQDVRDRYQDELDDCADREAQAARLCELNVIDQVTHVCQTSIVRDAWRRGQALAVHGWIYDLDDGRIRDLETSASSAQEADARGRSLRAG
ncbi:MAG TPA: carbonate dehydratase [Planctomycetota bacterium]